MRDRDGKKLADYLRALAKAGQYGHSRTPRSYYMVDSYCSYYWDSHGRVPTHEIWVAVSKLSARYRRLCHYVTETLPEWKEVRQVYYMDNSTESVQRDRHGNERRVMLVAPHGDVCY